jgi:hypothetical protein
MTTLGRFTEVGSDGDGELVPPRRSDGFVLRGVTDEFLDETREAEWRASTVFDLWTEEAREEGDSTEDGATAGFDEAERERRERDGTEEIILTLERLGVG